MMRLLHTLCFWVFLALSVFSCRPEGDIVRVNKESFTASDQAKIGSALTNHILENPIEYPIYEPSSHPDLYFRLNQLLSQVVNTSIVENRNEFNWKLFVVKDSENMTAFTLPGGKIFITDGFLKFIANEAQLLAVLSHEMNYADHGASMGLLKNNFSGLLLGDLVFNNPVEEIDDMVKSLRQLSVSENQVEAADLYSAELLCPFSYTSDALATLLETELPDDEYPFEWLDTRPGSTEERITFIRTSTRECGVDTDNGTVNYNKYILNFLD